MKLGKVKIDCQFKQQRYGDCRCEDTIESIFGSVSDFALKVDDNFGNYAISYDEDNIHSFFVKD